MVKKLKLRKTFLYSALFLAAFVVACTPSGQKHGVVTPGEITFAMQSEPPNLDQTKNTDGESGIIVGHMLEGLVSTSPEGKILPAVAEAWEQKNKLFSFKLRKNAKWSDGKPVTAHDFVYAWRRVVDPKHASQYAFIMYYLKNAEAITKGKMPVDSLGVRAIDDFTLEVTLENPCGFFLSVVSSVVFFPMREDFAKAQGEKYGSNPENLLFNGPFKLAKWIHGSSLRLEKNEFYWNRDIVKIKAINSAYILPDFSAQYNLFKDGKVDYTPLTKETLPSAQKGDARIHKFVEGTLFYFVFNFRDNRITKNRNLRLAIKNLIDNANFISRVIKIPGTQEGVGLIPAWMQGTNSFFRKEYPLPLYRPNYEAAQKHMAAARKELNLTGPIALSWLTSDGTTAKDEAEYFQGLFKRYLNIDLKIDVQTFKQRLKKSHTGDFDILSAGWGPDYLDPMTFADLLTSWNDNNHGRWQNADYDALIRKAQADSNTKVRMDSMAAAERILVDDAALIPMYERTRLYVTAPGVSGIVRQRAGPDPGFTTVTVE